MTNDLRCKDKVRGAYESRLEDIRLVWEAYRDGDEERHAGEIGTWPEYGLAFDYVPAGTFSGQRRGYFRYQISTGGPGEEIRFFADEALNMVKAEFWYLDWFDGASVRVKGRHLETLKEIWEDFQEMDLLSLRMEEAL